MIGCEDGEWCVVHYEPVCKCRSHEVRKLRGKSYE